MKSMQLKEWYIVVNTRANDGTSNQDWHQIQQLLTQHGFNYEAELTISKRHATKLVMRAIEKGYRKVIAVGGGGTVNEAINGIILQKHCDSKDVLFTVIPTGAFNDWTKHHRIPIDYEEWIPQIKEENISPHSVGKVSYYLKGIKSEWHFIGVLGGAFTGFVVKEVNEELSNFTTRFTMFYKMWRYVLKFRRSEVKLSYEGKSSSKKFIFINIALCKFLGGLMAAPHANPTAGKLFIDHDAGNVSFLTFMKAFFKTFANLKVKSRNNLLGKSTWCKIEPINSERPCFVHTDGEFLGEAPCEVTVLPNAMQVILPKYSVIQ